MQSAYTREYPTIYKGIVESNEDPDNLGRCRVRVPAAHGELAYNISSLPWARPIASTPVGEKRGSSSIPDVGDIVWVMFEGGKKDYPLYFGGTYSKGRDVIEQNKIVFYVEDDNKITYDRENKVYSIQVGGNSIEISDKGITIEGDTVISGDVKIKGKLTISDLIVSGSANISSLTPGHCSKEGTHV